MARLLLIFSYIFLTSHSAWSQSAPAIDLEGLKAAAPEAVIIDARFMSDESVKAAVRMTLRESDMENSAVRLSQNQLASDGMGLKVKQFIILKGVSDVNEDYSATLLAASYVRKSYSGEADKVKHVNYGYGIGLSSTIAIHSFLKGTFDAPTANFLSRTLGVLTACAVGAGKEVFYDRNRQDSYTVDKRDFYATCQGGAGMMLGQVNFSF